MVLTKQEIFAEVEKILEHLWIIAPYTCHKFFREEIENLEKDREKQPLSEFYSHKLTKDGKSMWCKSCHKRNYQGYMKTASGVYTSIKGRQTYYKTKPFLISREAFVKWYDSTRKQCSYCGIEEHELSSLGDSYNNKAHRLTVDCIDNSIGYVEGNLVLACLRCNSIKSDFFTHEEMKRLSMMFIFPKWEEIWRGQ